MKTISLKQPFGYLLCSGIKPIENRSWKLPEKHKGKTVLIHASAKPVNIKLGIKGQATVEEIQMLSALNLCDENDLYSAIIGSVRFVDCVINHPSMWVEKMDIPDLGEVLSDIHFFGRSFPPKKIIHNWVVADPVLFKKPILNVKGKLGFWDYPMTEEEYLNLAKIGL